ncbi:MULTISPECIES: hypothetical protein [unclassified Motilimonas]|uniref:hypothetical protein n=1 Tax=unclassified Motilimonas TaxID=2643697 RepID=UPI001E2D07F0|nr:MULTISPECIES: hypothetical protein [unclassified Motilimonas]MCE0556496.1 hypothetical protein [Motilimonas sp. E26]MDO6528134.1 hypothetical protein [Motilimonas sp. 1_MG-2023]
MRLFAVVICSTLSLPLMAFATTNECAEESIKMVAKSDATAGIVRYQNLVIDYEQCEDMDESYAKELYDFSYDLTYSQVCHGEEGFKLGKAGKGPNPVCKDYVNAGYYRHRHAQGIERYKEDVLRKAKKEAAAKAE